LEYKSITVCAVVKDTCTKRTQQGSRRKMQTGTGSQSRNSSKENYCWKVAKLGQYLAATRDQKEGSREEVNVLQIHFN